MATEQEKRKFNSRTGLNYDRAQDIFTPLVNDITGGGGGGGGITPAEVDQKIEDNNTTYVDPAIDGLQTNIDTKANIADVNTSLDLKADKTTTYTKTEVDTTQASQDTLIQANNDAITLLNAPAGTPGAIRTISTEITQNSTNFGKIFSTSGSIAIPTTKTNLNIGTFSGGFYSSAGTVLTITKGGLISLRFHSTLDGGSTSRNVELAIEISTDGGTTWNYAPNSLRLWEQSTVNADRNAFFADPVPTGTRFRLAYSASGTGVSFIQPVPTVLTGATGYVWLIELEWKSVQGF